jgi:hypothetical protein
MVGRATRLSPNKTKAAVIDMVDASRKHSVVSLPSLLGLPPSFNLGGRDATNIAERYQRLADRDPDVAAMVQDAATLAMLEGIPSDEQRAKLTRKLLDQAKASNTYISVDLFRPPAMPADADEFTRMVWVPQGDDAYRLRLTNATMVIEGDVVGNYRVTVRRESGAITNLGTFHGMREAFTAGEAWVRGQRGENLNFLDKRVAWRQKPATPKQISLLKRYRIKADASMTAGEASDALDHIMQGLASGTIHARRRA